MSDVTYKKAIWIADGLNEDADDVYDILLGVIKHPQELVNEVERAAEQYDQKRKLSAT
jgi:hypothetical protein